MLKNYFKIALRNLRRNKAYMLINVLGLTLGITCAILIFSIINHHLSFNNFHKDSGRIYRIVTEQHRDNVSYTPGVPSPLGKEIRKDYDFAEHVARIASFGDMLISVEDDSSSRKFNEQEGIAFTETAYFAIFNFPLLQGNINVALTEPNTAIITERLAKKYFGNRDPINKIIKVDGRLDFKISGVLKDLPANTDQRCEIFVSYSTLKQFNEWLASDDAWGGIMSAMHCYIKLRPNVTPQQVEAALPAFVKKYRPTSKNVHHYKLQSLADIHFDSRYTGIMEKKNLWALGFIAAFLIITACVNFINLATAQALNRSKEIGVRKVLGSKRAQLFWQFITETGFITILSVLVAIGLAIVTLPVVNEWFRSNITTALLTDWRFLLFLPLLILLVTFFAGSYPGIILARFQPIQALKSKLSIKNSGGFNTRRGLIITQFAISQVLIIAVIVITRQMHYTQNADLGFNKEAIILVPVVPDAQKAKTLKNELKNIAGVYAVTECFSPPSSYNNWGTSTRYDNRQEDEAFRLNVKAGDEDYLETFGITLLAGRNVFPSDSVREFLVNETFTKKINLTSPEQVVGKKLQMNGNMEGTIVGVVNDFHDQSFFSDINAVCITTYPDNYYTYAIKVNAGNLPATLQSIEKAWSAMNPAGIYQQEFMDEHLSAFYESEELMLKLIRVFSFIAIIIGCLGLYGLVSFMAAQRTKEIGIRKVLGGSVAQVWWIFGKEFSKLIVIAFVIAAPVGYWLMSGWLEDFKYRIPINAGVFLLVILITFVISMLTVGYRSVKAALANPVKSLRAE